MTKPEETSFLFIINDAPYGNERPYNALRLALNLVKRPEVHVQVFLMGDGVNCAIAGQKTTEGYYNVERMLKSLAQRAKLPPEGHALRLAGSSPNDLSMVSGLATWTLPANGH